MKILQLYYSEEHIKLPKEDAWAFDKKSLAFAVADGVHLFPGIEYERGRNYPSPSPAGKLAQEFCKNFLKYQKRTNLKNAFARANRSVFYLNKKRNRGSTILKAEAYYAATAAFGRVNGKTLEWGGICDSSVTVLDSRGKILLFHTDHLHHNDFDPILAKYFRLDQSYMLRTIFRNALSSTGKKIGYGVVTGEKEAEPYAFYGKRKLGKGDIVIFATDGFEKYLQISAFRRALLTFDKKVIEEEMARLKKARPNEREFFSERTLVVVKP